MDQIKIVVSMATDSHHQLIMGIRPRMIMPSCFIGLASFCRYIFKVDSV